MQVAGPTREILALGMHPMQKAIAKEELYKAAERALVTAVAQVNTVSVCMPPPHTHTHIHKSCMAIQKVNKQELHCLFFCLAAVTMASVMGYMMWHAQDMPLPLCSCLVTSRSCSTSRVKHQQG